MDHACFPFTPTASSKKLGASPPSLLLVITFWKNGVNPAPLPTVRRMGHKPWKVESLYSENITSPYSLGHSSTEEQDFLFLPLVQLRYLLFLGWILHVSVLVLVDCLLQCLPQHMRFGRPGQLAQPLAGQVHSSLRSKHKIRFSLPLVWNFDLCLRKVQEEVNNPKNRARLLYWKHPIGPGARHEVKGR